MGCFLPECFPLVFSPSVPPFPAGSSFLPRPAQPCRDAEEPAGPQGRVRSRGSWEQVWPLWLEDHAFGHVKAGSEVRKETAESPGSRDLRPHDPVHPVQLLQGRLGLLDFGGSHSSSPASEGGIQPLPALATPLGSRAPAASGPTHSRASAGTGAWVLRVALSFQAPSGRESSQPVLQGPLVASPRPRSQASQGETAGHACSPQSHLPPKCAGQRGSSRGSQGRSPTSHFKQTPWMSLHLPIYDGIKERHEPVANFH